LEKKKSLVKGKNKEEVISVFENSFWSQALAELGFKKSNISEVDL
jgi:hypothetical protein